MSDPYASLDSKKGNQMYRVYHLNVYKRSFSTRDAALAFVSKQRTPEDFEILDKSDF